MVGYSLYKSVPWIVNLFLLWKPLYKKTSNNEKLLDYIETLVFIHSVYDSEGKEVSAEDIDYLELFIDEDNTINILKTEVNEFGKENNGDKLNKNIEVNCYGDDTSIGNLNVRLGVFKNEEYHNTGFHNFYSCGNFVKKILGSYYINESAYKDNVMKAYQNGILFKIHMKGGKRYANYTYNPTKRKYKESSSKYKDSAVIYGVASNPFYFPKYIFNTSLPSTEDEALSFGSNLASNNITQCFVCDRNIGSQFTQEKHFKVCYYDKSELTDIKRYAENNANISNYNFTLSVKELRNEIYSLKLASPFPWMRGGLLNYNTYQRYDDNNYNTMDDKYANDNINENIVIYNIKDYLNNIRRLKFLTMSKEAKDEIKVNLSPYTIAKVSATDDKFVWLNSDDSENSSYDGNYYVASVSSSQNINLGNVICPNNSHKNIICKLTDDNTSKPYIASPKDVYTDNKWFFGYYSLKDKPSLLFYGMYKVTGSTTGE